MIKTNRLTLIPAPIAGKQFTDFLALLYTDKQVVEPFGWNGILMEQVEQFSVFSLQLYARHFETCKFGAWAIQDENGYCGLVELRVIEDLENGYYCRDGEIELLYHLDPKVWGKGYATEAASGAIDYVKSLKNAVISAEVKKTNLGSKRVLEKLGMVELPIGTTNYVGDGSVYYGFQ
jgi:RimJ/RimL family protein N-acetyltransferase